MNRLLHLCLLLVFVFTAAERVSAVVLPVEITPYSLLADTIPPTITCPASLSVNLEPLACDTILTYTVEADDDQGQVIVIKLNGIASGESFPAGTTVNTYLATDLAGNTATCSFSIIVQEAGGGIIFCMNQTSVYLDTACSKTLDAFEVLDMGTYGCPASYYVEIDKTAPFGNGPWSAPIFSVGDVGKTYQARVTSLIDGSKCSGSIFVKDSIPPVILVDTINVPCILPLSQLTPMYLLDSFGIIAAIPIISDGCSGNMNAVSFVDVPQTIPCNDTSTISGVIRRIWSATDLVGNTRTVTQIINRNRLLSNVMFPAGTTTNCQNPDLTPETNGKPFIQFANHQYVLQPGSFCQFDAQHTDTIQPGACAGNYTVKRTWKVYDACLPLSATNPKIGVQNIEVKDVVGPVVHCPDDIILTVADNNCRTPLDFPNVYLSDFCSELVSIQVFWTDSSITKNLTGIIEYQTDSTGVDTVGVLGAVASFPIGTTIVLYTAEDACGNTGDCSFSLTMANLTPPTAICDSMVTIALPPSGYAVLSAESLDNGSSDDCSPLFFKAQFAGANSCSPDSTLADSLFVCCHNQGDTLQGILRVYDIGVPSGHLPGSYGIGHFSDCQFRVVVSGSTLPICTAPDNITLHCESFDPTMLTNDLPLSQSCSVDSVAQMVDYTQFDTLCNRGTLTRTFQVFDTGGQMGQCSQSIVVDYEQDYYIRFPNDVIVTVCDSATVYGKPLFFGEDCESLVAEYEDVQFNVVPDACYKIERTWKIINLCTYDPDLPTITVPNPSPNAVTNHPDNLVGPVVSPIQTSGSPWRSTVSKINPTDVLTTNYSIFYDKNANAYSYKQIIKVIDTKKPVIENCTATAPPVLDSTSNDALLWNAAYWYDPTLNTHDLCEAPSNISITASDACSGAMVHFDFNLILDLDNDGVLETLVNSNDLPPSNTIYFDNLNGIAQTREFDFRPVAAGNKWRFALEEQVVGNKKTATIRFHTTDAPSIFAPMQLPHGTHKIKWFVTDNCGNESICERTFTVRDGKPPVVFCDQGLSANLQPTGTIQFSSYDFLQYGEDNCTPDTMLVYAIRRAGMGSGFPIDTNMAPVTTVAFNCLDLGAQQVEVWARDKAGNAGFCVSNFTVSDNGNSCLNQPFDIAGHVTTELNEGIGDVSINLEGWPPLMPPLLPNPVDITDTTGFYSVSNSIPLGSSLSIKPEYDANPLNGVTTYDLVLISKHILGIEPLGSPYKMVAADANKSGSVTTFDIVEVRKLILGIYQHLPNNTSWRFIPKSYGFSNMMNPFADTFPTAILLLDLSSGASNGDFIGVKVGDVNDSAVPHAIAPADDRSAGTLHFKVEADGAETLQPGEIFNVRFEAEKTLVGCQFTLNFNGMEVLEIIPGENLTLDNFGLFPNEKALTMAWEKGGNAVFTLKCKATSAANLRDMISMGSRITKAEAYLENGALPLRFDLALLFPVMSSFELFQNQPNPFSEATEISFNLPESGMVTLKVSDVNGRVLYTHTGYYERGMHTVPLRAGTLDATGVLYYQIETGKYKESRRMVRL